MYLNEHGLEAIVAIFFKTFLTKRKNPASSDTYMYPEHIGGN